MATKNKPAEKKPTDVELVKASAAAPHASLAGTEQVLESGPVRIRVIDGARAVIEVDKHDPLTQADLQAVVKIVNRAIQGTY